MTPVPAFRYFVFGSAANAARMYQGQRGGGHFESCCPPGSQRGCVLRIPGPTLPATWILKRLSFRLGPACKLLSRPASLASKAVPRSFLGFRSPGDDARVAAWRLDSILWSPSAASCVSAGNFSVALQHPVREHLELEIQSRRNIVFQNLLSQTQTLTHS